VREGGCGVGGGRERASGDAGCGDCDVWGSWGVLHSTVCSLKICGLGEGEGGGVAMQLWSGGACVSGVRHQVDCL